MPVFISYRREDSAGYAGRLHEELEQRLGRDQVFRDLDSLRAGQDFVDVINGRLRDCGALVAVIGPDWLSVRTASGERRLEQRDDYVALEIAAALARADVLVVPVLVGGAAMPATSELPERLRSLARRHALALRDETWDGDVDRLAALLTQARGGDRVPLRRAAIFLAFVAVAIVAAALFLRGGNRPDAEPSAAPSAAPAPIAVSAYTLDMPGLAEASHGSVIYTLLSGNVFPRGGGTSGIRLRVRVSNEGLDDANLSDASFQLVVGDHVLTPTSGLNEVVPHRSITQAIVTFTAPAGPSRAALRVLDGGAVAEIPLDLSPTGRAVEDENADAGDVLSRARLALLQRGPTPLVADKGFSATLSRVTSRLFVNKRRVNVGVSMKNDGRDPLHTGALTLRLADGGELAAPVSAPNETLEAGSTFSGDFVFEISPSSKKIELRASAGNDSARVPLEVR